MILMWAGVGLAVLALAVWALVVLLAESRQRPMVGDVGLLGARAEVVESFEAGHIGRVRLQGELWNATGGRDMRAGELARVVAVDGLLLRVEPWVGPSVAS